LNQLFPVALPLPLPYFPAMFDTRHQLLSLITALETDIRERPDRRQTELSALKAALKAIEGSSAGMSAPATPGGAKPREGSKKEFFRLLVNGLIDAQPNRLVHRTDILGHMQALDEFSGIENVERAMSKYLSMDGTFEPAGDGFWRRKPKGDAAKAPNEIRP
jgi:hypothetical protein